MITKVMYAVLLLVICSSCVSTQKAVYLDNISDTMMTRKMDNLELVLQKNDLLSITVSSPNPVATQIFNTPNTVGKEASAPGYLIGQDGRIDFPLLGSVPAAGLTKKQLTDTIAAKLSEGKLLANPVVTVRYLNFKVTVLGEVAHPTVINVPDEKLSLLEALGLAGDMTIYAKRNNVMVIREEEGVRIVRRLNLNSKELFTSPYYYLKSNDIVYVEPNKARISSSSNLRIWLPMVMSALSVAAVIFYRVSR
ncbi:polysaccharide biosynthesis/export family protein [Paraflavisolibacter sp. H34]|uniref:polysaccharide biosynthesis/export family protein n=1 Tax=Huijunlia imazamoxiresistens TaxID=3127457 RepID=UPI0030195791